MSRPKSLDRDREIRRDPRSAWIFVFSCRDFSIRRDFRPWQCWDFSTNLENLDASQQISTISTRLNKLDKNLDASKSRLKNLDFKNLDREKKSWSRPSRKSRQFKKVSLDTKDVLDLDLDWSRLSRPPGLILWAGRTNDSFYGQVGQKTHFMYRSDKWRILHTSDKL